MAFFKFRKGAEEQSAPAPAPESVETLRKRARHRLVGAVILVLAGVVGFPMLFDNQPRPIAVDIPIDIPDKAKGKTLALPADAPLPAAAVAVAGSGIKDAEKASEKAPEKSAAKDAGKDATKEPSKDSGKEPAKGAAAGGSVDKQEEIIVPSKSAAKTHGGADGHADKPAAKSSESNKTAASDGGRFIVQFGSYTESAKAHEARLKVEKAGLKTYAQTIDTADGKKFRVRVGPFDTRAEAEKAAAKIKKLDLPANVLAI